MSGQTRVLEIEHCGKVYHPPFPLEVLLSINWCQAVFVIEADGNVVSRMEGTIIITREFSED